MKKLFASLLTCVMLASVVFTGCGTNNDNSKATPAANEKVTISFWHGYTPEKEAILKEMIARYQTENPNVVIVPKFTASGEEMLQKVQSAILTNDIPDLVWGFPTWTGVLASSGKLKELNTVVDDGMKKDIFKGLMDCGTLNGKLYSIPVEAGALVLIYNKDMFAEAGLKDAPKDWDELYTYAKALTNDKHKGIWLPIKPDERTTWTWETFLWQNSGSLLDSSEKAIAFDSEKGLEAFKMYAKFIKDGYSLKDIGNDPFIEKQAAMIFGTQGAANSYISKYKMNVGVADLPKKDKIATGLGSNHLFIFKTGDKKEKAALDFCKWMTSGKNNAEWVTKTGYLPVSQSGVDSDVFKKFGSDNPHMLVAANTLKYGVARPAIEQYPKISTLIAQAIEYAAFDKKSPEDAFKDAAAEAKKILK